MKSKVMLHVHLIQHCITATFVRYKLLLKAQKQPSQSTWLLSEKGLVISSCHCKDTYKSCCVLKINEGGKCKSLAAESVDLVSWII